MIPKPSISRMVHFVMDTGKNIGAHRPAIITNVITDDGVCALSVMPDAARDGVGFILVTSSTMHSEAKRPGTWHWPEREEVLPKLTPNEDANEAGRESRPEGPSEGRLATAEEGNE